MSTMYRGNPSEELWLITCNFVLQKSRILLKLSGMTKPPFLPEKYAQLQKVNKITKEDLGNLSGLLLPMHDGFEIKLNATHSAERQNFSLAHETGHTFFREKNGQILREIMIKRLGVKKAKSDEEYLCDIVASELLMPFFIFAKYGEKFSYTINSLSTLSRLFNVSIIPVALKLCDVNPRLNCLVYWIKENSDELVNPKFKATWLTWSLKNPTTKKNRFINGKLIDNDFNVLTAYNSENPISINKQIGIRGYRGNCEVWSQGFGTGKDRFVLSFAFPEKNDH